MLSLVLAPQVAMADLGSVLGEVEWGDDRDTVLEKLRAAKLDAVRNDPQFQGNPGALQRARQQTLDRLRRVEDSYYELEGRRTDYHMSVVSGEFTSNNGESLLRVRDRVAQRFYFFLDGEFYKLTVAYDTDHVANIGFEAFVNRVQQEYGEPASRDYDGDELRQVTWEDGEFKLRVDDQREYFGTFTMTFSDRQRVQRWSSEGREFGGNHQEEEEGPSAYSQRVEAVTGPSEGRRQSAADALIGGLGEDVALLEEEEEDEEVAETRPDPRPSEPAREERPASRPTPTTSASDDDDLVIY